MRYALIFLCFLPPCSYAAPKNTTTWYGTEHTVHAFRTAQGKHQDLRPLFSWIVKGDIARRKGLPFLDANPMPQWTPIRGRVLSVAENGILLTQHMNARGRDRVIFVRNYPPDLKPVDGEYVRILVVEHPDTYQYKATDGGLSTVASFDYGVVFVPKIEAPKNHPE